MHSGRPPLGAFCLLAALVAAGHIHCWARHPPAIDPVNFVCALRAFDVAGDAPHPPGYPLFVGAGMIAEAFVGEARAFQLVNLLFMIGTGLGIVLIGSRLRNPAVGLATAAIFMTHPLVWSTTAIQDSYIVDAFFSTWLVYAVVRARGRSAAALAGAAFIPMLALALSRPVSCAMILPLGAVTALAMSPGPRLLRGASVGAAGALATALGFLTTITLAGGYATYSAATDRVMGGAFRGASVLGGAPVSEHAAMMAKLLAWFALLAAPGAAVAALALVVRGRPRLELAPAAVCLAWILPPLGFYAAIYYLKPPYHLIYLPAVLALFAWATCSWLMRGRPRAAAALVGALAAAQVAFFMFGPPTLPPQLHRLTADYIRLQDRHWDALLADLSGVPRERTVVIWHSHPALHSYSLRLVPHPGPFAVPVGDGSALQFFTANPHRWIDETVDSIPEGIDSAAVVVAEGGRGLVRVVELKGTADRRVEAVIAAAMSPGR